MLRKENFGRVGMRGSRENWGGERGVAPCKRRDVWEKEAAGSINRFYPNRDKNRTLRPDVTPQCLAAIGGV